MSEQRATISDATMEEIKRICDQPPGLEERAAEMADDMRRSIYCALVRGDNVTVAFIPAVITDRMTMRSCAFLNGLFAGDAHRG